LYTFYRLRSLVVAARHRAALHACSNAINNKPRIAASGKLPLSSFCLTPQRFCACLRASISL